MDPWFTQPIPSFESVNFVIFLIIVGGIICLKKLIS